MRSNSGDGHLDGHESEGEGIPTSPRQFTSIPPSSVDPQPIVLQLSQGSRSDTTRLVVIVPPNKDHTSPSLPSTKLSQGTAGGDVENSRPSSSSTVININISLSSQSHPSTNTPQGTAGGAAEISNPSSSVNNFLSNENYTSQSHPSTNFPQGTAGGAAEISNPSNFLSNENYTSQSNITQSDGSGGIPRSKNRKQRGKSSSPALDPIITHNPSTTNPSTTQSIFTPSTTNPSTTQSTKLSSGQKKLRYEKRQMRRQTNSKKNEMIRRGMGMNNNSGRLVGRNNNSGQFDSGMYYDRMNNNSGRLVGRNNNSRQFDSGRYYDRVDCGRYNDHGGWNYNDGGERRGYNERGGWSYESSGRRGFGQDNNGRRGFGRCNTNVIARCGGRNNNGRNNNYGRCIGQDNNGGRSYVRNNNDDVARCGRNNNDGRGGGRNNNNGREGGRNNNGAFRTSIPRRGDGGSQKHSNGYDPPPLPTISSFISAKLKSDAAKLKSDHDDNLSSIHDNESSTAIQSSDISYGSSLFLCNDKHNTSTHNNLSRDANRNSKKIKSFIAAMNASPTTLSGSDSIVIADGGLAASMNDALQLAEEHLSFANGSSSSNVPSTERQLQAGGGAGGGGGDDDNSDDNHNDDEDDAGGGGGDDDNSDNNHNDDEDESCVNVTAASWNEQEQHDAKAGDDIVFDNSMTMNERESTMSIAVDDITLDGNITSESHPVDYINAIPNDGTESTVNAVVINVEDYKSIEALTVSSFLCNPV
jgi:hypothetical protein